MGFIKVKQFVTKFNSIQKLLIVKAVAIEKTVMSYGLTINLCNKKIPVYPGFSVVSKLNCGCTNVLISLYSR